ncbi:MAG: acyl-CoA dehydrogenase [Frankiales bacterium]|nr:acyl-CoA dehydrogenase [Frankiales bacterium]
MTIDFSLDDEIVQLADKVRTFMSEVVIPAEAELVHGAHGYPDELRKRLQSAARDAGIFAPHVPTEYGGLGLDTRGQAVVFEIAGRSLLGPPALNCAAPDEGNMLLLEKVASDAQKIKYLAPLAAGDVRSSFAMTEPAPGAGSDPNRLATRAELTDDGWVINGTKWFITGADGAAFFIVMTRTGTDKSTMLLVDADNPGVEVTRRIDSLDSITIGGHCEVVFTDCRVPEDAVLGAADRGFEYAQVRLAPARLTHCMRWLGIAQRAHEFAVHYASQREMFGSTEAALGMAQLQFADNEIDLAASRALIWQAAYALDQGQRAAQETSVAKTFVAEATNRVVDRALQLCGALGVSHDAPLASFLAEIRPFRIYDGPSEAHRWALARRAVRRYGVEAPR